MQIETVIGALADPTRLRIMRLLDHLELAVGELAQVLGQSQPRISRHVAVLCDSGLVERRREGSWVFLRSKVARNSARPLAASIARLLQVAEQEDAAFARRCADDRRHLAAIRDLREKHAASYFERTAEEWDRLRALLCPDDLVETALLAALGPNSLGRLLDIGTGTGRMADLLSSQSDHVVGLDRSPEMLRLARARLQKLPPGRWELVQGDFTTLPFDVATFDTIILHQVLHYAQEPSYVLQEAARVCRAGGRLVVVDLAAHDQEELRQRHAHIRLGFSDEQMQTLLAHNGFEPTLPAANLPGSRLTTNIWIAQRTPDEIIIPETAQRLRLTRGAP